MLHFSIFLLIKKYNYHKSKYVAVLIIIMPINFLLNLSSGYDVRRLFLMTKQPVFFFGFAFDVWKIDRLLCVLFEVSPFIFQFINGYVKCLQVNLALR